MVTKNDITGDKIQSKISNKAFEENFDNIFGKKKPKELWTDEDEKRIDQIGQNGNEGNHYNDEV